MADGNKWQYRLKICVFRTDLLCVGHAGVAIGLQLRLDICALALVDDHLPGNDRQDEAHAVADARKLKFGHLHVGNMCK